MEPFDSTEQAEEMIGWFQEQYYEKRECDGESRKKMRRA
ncbi:hypothetical protein BACIH_1777 [Bacillus amyloliquefaciens]|nr:hypothetical protein U471_18020 [Bacillus amyloliquefaciens CC178]QEY91718.1 hypothetical protein BACIT_3961 [Bacillus amyloliquefaciens]QEY93517.1 hypothetical protein BACIH_1777 [Bacillus amyloliquefaciens]